MRKGTKLGRIFLDMHARDNKFKHAAQFPMVSGVGGMQLPRARWSATSPSRSRATPR